MNGLENKGLFTHGVYSLGEKSVPPALPAQAASFCWLENMSFVERVVVFVKQFFTNKNQRDFSQILYKIRPCAFDPFLNENSKLSISTEIFQNLKHMQNISEAILLLNQCHIVKINKALGNKTRLQGKTNF